MIRCVLTLCADQDQRYFGRIAIVCHFRVISVHGVETRLVLQAEYEYHRVHPGGKLENNKYTELQRIRVLHVNTACAVERATAECVW